MPGTLTISTLSDGTNSTSSTNSIRGPAKAWANFDASSGAISIRSSYNISSITYNTTGEYTANFTTSFADANYCAVGSVSKYSPRPNDGNEVIMFKNKTSGTYGLTASSARFTTLTPSGNSGEDCPLVCVAFIGN